MQWVRFSGMYLFILFIISPFPQPPCSSVQKWHLFSQTTRLHPFTFSTDGFFLTLVQSRVRLSLMNVRVCILEKYGFLHLFSLRNVSPPGALSSTCARYKRVRSPSEQISNKQTLMVKSCGLTSSKPRLFIYAVCERPAARKFTL